MYFHWYGVKLTDWSDVVFMAKESIAMFVCVFVLKKKGVDIAYGKFISIL